MDFRKKVILFIFACIAFSPIYNVVADTGSFTSIAGIVYKLQSGTYIHATTYKETRLNYSACSTIGIPYSDYFSSSCAYLATTHALYYTLSPGTEHMHIYQAIPGLGMDPHQIEDIFFYYTFPLQ